MVNPQPSPSHINAGQFKSELSISDDEDEGQDHRRRSQDPIANVLDPYVKGNQTENKDVRRIGPGMELSTISDQDGEMKASRIMINYGVCKLSVDDVVGRHIHTAYTLLLPLISIFVLILQNSQDLVALGLRSEEVADVGLQVNKSLALSELVQRLQEERAAVAINIFLNRSSNVDTMSDLQPYVISDFQLSRYNLLRTFNKTDSNLERIQDWPQIPGVDYFKTKLKFQIRHSIFRSKIREGVKDIYQVLGWYDRINTLILDYISITIKDSDVSSFYRYVISMKNLLRATEYTGKAGIFGIRYLSAGALDKDKYQDLVKSDWLRREYLNQTFNFMPELEVDYYNSSLTKRFGSVQNMILAGTRSTTGVLTQAVSLGDAVLSLTQTLTRSERSPQEDSQPIENSFNGINNTGIPTATPLMPDSGEVVSLPGATTLTDGPNITVVEAITSSPVSSITFDGITTPERVSINYFVMVLLYSRHLKSILTGVGEQVEQFVVEELDRIHADSHMPTVYAAIAVIMLPGIVYITLKAANTMYQLSEYFRNVCDAKRETAVKKVDFQTNFFPINVIREMKLSQKMYAPRVIENVTMLTFNVIDFSVITRDAEADAICATLNKFEEALKSRISIYPSFFKVINKIDSFMISDVSESERTSSTKDIVNLAFDLRTEVIIFEVTHRPGYQLKARLGVHCGTVCVGVAKTFVLLGEDVELAWKMEQTAEPLKIQASGAILDKLNSAEGDVTKLFDFKKRTPGAIPGLSEGFATYWINGRHTTRDQGDTGRNSRAGQNQPDLTVIQESVVSSKSDPFLPITKNPIDSPQSGGSY